MATYKVLQDIEAEDKLIGPLSLRQFIYAGICIGMLYICFWGFTHNVPYLTIIFLPVAVVSGFFAWPFAGEQPTEVWALAKIRFLIKPRKRIWNQSGVKELVTITAPKKLDPILTNGLSQLEVQSRLRVLADTIDSRGWAIKNVNINMYGQVPLMMPASDRLVGPSSLPQEVPAMDIRPSDDILDERNNPVAQQFDNMIAASEREHRQRLITTMQAPAVPTPPAPVQTPQQPANDYWFLNQPSQPMNNTPQNAVTFNTQVVAPRTPPAMVAPVVPVVPDPSPIDEQKLLEQLHAQDTNPKPNYSHLHTIQPLSAQRPAPRKPAPMPAINRAAKSADSPVTQQHNTAILDLVSNNDLNVATIAREANKRRDLEDEVVISLH